MAQITDADKVLRNDTGKDIVTQLTSIASSIATPASLVGLSDTAITTPTDGQELTYNSSLSKWNNKTTRVELTQQQYDLLVANNEDLPDVDYYITDAGGAEVVSSAPNISDVYNPNTTYNTGDLCIYNNVLYKCKTNSVTGAWDGTKWDRTTVDELLANTATAIGNLSDLNTTDKSSLVGAVNTLSAITPATDITPTETPSRNDYFKYCKCGHIVCIGINNLGYVNNFSTDTKIGAIPYTPTLQYTRGYLRNGDNNSVSCLVNQTGEIYINGNGAGKLLYGTIWVMVND